MLILRRKKDESILIGENIRITIVDCAADGVRIAIDAPKQVSILREELSQATIFNQEALAPQASSISSFSTLLHHQIHAEESMR